MQLPKAFYDANFGDIIKMAGVISGAFTSAWLQAMPAGLSSLHVAALTLGWRSNSRLQLSRFCGPKHVLCFPPRLQR